MDSSRPTQPSTEFTPAHIKFIATGKMTCGTSSLAAALGEKFVKGMLSDKQNQLLFNDVNKLLGKSGLELQSVDELRGLLTEYYKAPVHLQSIFGLCFHSYIEKFAATRQSLDAFELIDHNGLTTEAALKVIAEQYDCNVYFFALHNQQNDKIYQLENKKIKVADAKTIINIMDKTGDYNLLADTKAEASEHNSAINRIVVTPGMPADAKNLGAAKETFGLAIAKNLAEMRKRNPKNSQSHDTGIGLGLTPSASALPASPSLAEYEKLSKQIYAKYKNPQPNNTSNFSGADSKRSGKPQEYRSYFFPKQLEGSSNKFVGETINISKDEQIELDALYARLDPETLDKLLERQRAVEGNSQPIRQKK